MNADVSTLTPVTRVGSGGSGIGKKIKEAVLGILETDNAAGINEIAVALEMDTKDKKVMSNLANHLFVLRTKGVIELAGADADGQKIYVAGDGEKKVKETKKKTKK